jgi:serine/threonine protein kinase
MLQGRQLRPALVPELCRQRRFASGPCGLASCEAPKCRACRRWRLSEQEVALTMMVPLLEAVHYMHERGIMHRDIKVCMAQPRHAAGGAACSAHSSRRASARGHQPASCCVRGGCLMPRPPSSPSTPLQPENVLCARGFQLKLADFGLAVDFTSEHASHRTGEAPSPSLPGPPLTSPGAWGAFPALRPCWRCACACSARPVGGAAPWLLPAAGCCRLDYNRTAHPNSPPPPGGHCRHAGLHAARGAALPAALP